MSFVSCWNANEALPGTVLTDQDIILSDQLNHASIIDGLRLAKSITKCETGVFQARRLRRARSEAGRRTSHRQVKDGRDRRHLLDGRIRLPTCRSCSKSVAGTALFSGLMTRTQPVCPRERRPRNGRAFRPARPDRYHHLDARQGAGWCGRRIRRRIGGTLRLPHATRPPPALYQCPPPDRGSVSPRCHRSIGGGAATGRQIAPEHRVFQEGASLPRVSDPLRAILQLCP